jgi:hypothetical protein
MGGRDSHLVMRPTYAVIEQRFANKEAPGRPGAFNEESCKHPGIKMPRRCQMEWIDRERERKIGPDEPS